MAAQFVSGTTRQDPYGHTLKNRQYECLVDHLRDADIPGMDLIHPAGAAFDLVRLDAGNTILFPWRFSSDQRVRHDNAQLPLARASTIRRGMLTVAPGEDDQLSLEDAAVSDEELLAQSAERREVEAQLRNLARVITIGYASNSTGIFELGWGEASLLDDGTVSWASWHPLTHLLAATRPSSDAAPGPRAVPGTGGADPANRGPRFDDAPLNTGFDLQPRHPLAGEPTTEPGEDTGKDAQGDTGDEARP
ncbi:hypothetical protein [Blastococcus sp. LR1]|uniref:hypothetical protein n=1 Tax=Blastococcus sp. LR1 TaxID=2877000 RepID=UPI001CCC09B3|nr:hypothetical protein [Blastococcus sp. LR1]MCA0143959.1 hypothetical protein [Blastococcus sp. LR1]